ncbi:hypothetical protein DVJ78_18165 (plasmid) [Humibacter sp. BT305]|nr:hypothetical protein DVJ78_18165 [Humibacter sp. BT305]
MTDTRPHSNRRTILLIVAGMVLVAVGGVVTWIVTTSPGGGAIPVTPAATATDDSWAESVCGLEGFEDSGELTTAPTVSWESVEGGQMPVSDTAGPGSISDAGVRTCFAHTLEGAVLAAAWAEFPYGQSWAAEREYCEVGLTEGAGQDVCRSTHPTVEPPAGNWVPTSRGVSIAGVHVESYTGTDAVIQVGTTTTVGAYNGSVDTVRLRWVDGDWKRYYNETSGGILPIYESKTVKSFDGLGLLPWGPAS